MAGQWSHLGADATSSETFASVRRALNRNEAKYKDRNFEVFLQGSYGNHTNIFSESDVDVVIRYDGAFFNNKVDLPPEQRAAFDGHFSNGSYPYNDFKSHVFETLEEAFGSAVTQSTRAIKIPAKDARRSADAIVAFQYRNYSQFTGPEDADKYNEGILFFTSDGARIINYPKDHSKNLTKKHQATNEKFKPTIRIFKNLRSKLVTDGLIEKDTAPSYFIEGLLYNIPDEKFSGNVGTVTFNVLQCLHATTEMSKFVCANERYYLLRNDSLVCWPTANAKMFVSAAIQCWNDWK